MKFILQIEVEAEECDNNNFPRETHAIQWLQDQLQEATTARLQFIMRADPKLSTHKYYVEAQENEVKAIRKAEKTIKLVNL